MKAIDRSVTDVPCSCGYLARAAKDPRIPIRFDSQANEYYVDSPRSAEATVSIVLYHCPMCGGVASKSKRDSFFAVVSEEEAVRINRLIENLRTPEHIESSLGKPDLDETVEPTAEFGLVQPGTRKPELGPIRVLTYRGISKTADVQFTVYSNGEIERAITPKPV